MFLTKKEEKNKVFYLPNKRYAIRDVAKLTGKGISTVQRVKKEFVAWHLFVKPWCHLKRRHNAKFPRYFTQKINNYKIICYQFARFNIHLAIKSNFFRVLLTVSFIFFLLFHKKVLFLQWGILYTDGFTCQRLSWRCISLVLWAHAVPLARQPLVRGGWVGKYGRRHN